MRNRPAVTVGMPFRNPGPFLEYAVRSLFAQTFDDWELVLIDDGSTDESVKLAAGIDDARVRLIRDGRALGLVPRLNQVIDLSRGRYIARMDADDMIHPHRLSAQLEFLEKNTGTDVVDSGAVILDAERNPVGVRGLERPSIPDVTDTCLRVGQKRLVHQTSLRSRIPEGGGSRAFHKGTPLHRHCPHS